MYEKVRTQFDAISSEYDASRRKLVPAFDSFYGAGIEFLSFGGDAPDVLDLGAGTGIFTSRLLERYPKASVTLLDFSENMLDLARKKFSENPYISFVSGDFSKEYLGDAQYDIVISALSLHHLTPEGKLALFQKLRTSLRDGGEFVNADIIKQADTELSARLDEFWTGFVRSNVGEGELFERFMASKNVDDPSTVEEQIDCLRSCGFGRAYCLFKYLNFAVHQGIMGSAKAYKAFVKG